MKGILFTQFLEFVERRFGLEVADSILTGTTLPLGGIYTSVGTYDHRELVTLLISLHQATGVAIVFLIEEEADQILADGRIALPRHGQFLGVSIPFAGSEFSEQIGISQSRRCVAPRFALPPFRLQMTEH